MTGCLWTSSADMAAHLTERDVRYVRVAWRHEGRCTPPATGQQQRSLCVRFNHKEQLREIEALPCISPPEMLLGRAASGKCCVLCAALSSQTAVTSISDRPRILRRVSRQLSGVA